MRTILALALTFGPALPAGAEVGLLVRPTDCILKAVIQFEECWFQRSYSCGSSERTIFRVELVAWDGAVSVEHRSAALMPAGFAVENSPIQSFSEGPIDAAGGSYAVLSPNAGHSEFQLTYSVFGVQNPMTVVVDQDSPRMAGRIDGIEFHRIVQNVEMRFQPPMPPVRGQTVLKYVAGGAFYYVEGGTTDFAHGTVMGPHKPMKIILPTEGAEEVTAPEFGCDELSTLLAPDGARFA